MYGILTTGPAEEPPEMRFYFLAPLELVVKKDFIITECLA